MGWYVMCDCWITFHSDHHMTRFFCNLFGGIIVLGQKRQIHPCEHCSLAGLYKLTAKENSDAPFYLETSFFSFNVISCDAAYLHLLCNQVLSNCKVLLDVQY